MEQILFSAEKCHVFRLPPSNSLKSEEWEGNHIWTGRIKLVRMFEDEVIPHHFVRLEDVNSGALFGECPLPDQNDLQGVKAFQPATDSTRCFVLRVVNEAKQHAYIGINFEDRSDAFSFSSSVAERHKRGLSQNMEERDRSLHQGEKIHVELAGKIKTTTVNPTTMVGAASSSSGSGTMNETGLLSSGPPPAPVQGKSRRIQA